MCLFCNSPTCQVVGTETGAHSCAPCTVASGISIADLPSCRNGYGGAGMRPLRYVRTCHVCARVFGCTRATQVRFLRNDFAFTKLFPIFAPVCF